MLVLNRKRIVFITTCICLFLALFLITEGAREIQENYISTVSLPVSDKVIIIDAGHGVPDEGAESVNGITEGEINLKIALKLQNLLEQSGSYVILTRSDENAIYDIDSKTLKQKKISDIKNRVKIGNESSADIFVSIHLNKIAQSQYDGWQTFYKSGSTDGEKLATSIQNGLNNAIQKENNRVPKTIENVYIIQHVEIPTTIVECGFLSNPDEEQLLQEDDYQNKLAWGIYTGIIEFFIL